MLVLFCAIVTLNEENVAGIVGAIYVGVAGFAALVAMRNHIFTDAFAHALIENKIFADEFIR